MLHPEFWTPDASGSACTSCHRPFSLLQRRHHCRHCGGIFCAGCSSRRLWLRPLRARQPRLSQNQQQQRLPAREGELPPLGGSQGPSFHPIAFKEQASLTEEESTGAGVSASPEATQMSSSSPVLSAPSTAMVPSSPQEQTTPQQRNAGGCDLGQLIHAASQRQRPRHAQDEKCLGERDASPQSLSPSRVSDEVEEGSLSAMQHPPSVTLLEHESASQEQQQQELLHVLSEEAQNAEEEEEGGTAETGFPHGSSEPLLGSWGTENSSTFMQRGRQPLSDGSHPREEEMWSRLSERVKRGYPSPAATVQETWYLCRVCDSCYGALTAMMDRATEDGAEDDVSNPSSTVLGAQNTGSLNSSLDPRLYHTSSPASPAPPPNQPPSAHLESSVLCFARRHVNLALPLACSQSSAQAQVRRDGAESMRADGDSGHLATANSSHASFIAEEDIGDRTPSFAHSPDASTSQSSRLPQGPPPTSAAVGGSLLRERSNSGSQSALGHDHWTGAVRRGSGSTRATMGPGALSMSQSLSLSWQAIKAQFSGTTPRRREEGDEDSRGGDDGGMRDEVDSIDDGFGSASQPPHRRPRITLSPPSQQRGGELDRAASSSLSAMQWEDSLREPLSPPSLATEGRVASVALGGSVAGYSPLTPGLPAAPQRIPPRLSVRTATALQRLVLLSRKERRVCVILVDERGYFIPNRSPSAGLAGNYGTLPLMRQQQQQPGTGTRLAEMFLGPYLPACAAPGVHEQVSRIKDSLTLLALYEELEHACASLTTSPHGHGSVKPNSQGNPGASSTDSPCGSRRVTPLPSPSLPPTRPATTATAGNARMASPLTPSQTPEASDSIPAAGGSSHDRLYLARSALPTVSSLQNSVTTVDNAGHVVVLPVPAPGPARRSIDVRVPVTLAPNAGVVRGGGVLHPNSNSSPVGSPGVPTVPTATPSSAATPHHTPLPPPPSAAARKTPTLSSAVSPLRPPSQTHSNTRGPAPAATAAAAPHAALASANSTVASTQSSRPPSPSLQHSTVVNAPPRTGSGSLLARTHANAAYTATQAPVSSSESTLRVPTKLVGIAVEVESPTAASGTNFAGVGITSVSALSGTFSDGAGGFGSDASNGVGGGPAGAFMASVTGLRGGSHHHAGAHGASGAVLSPVSPHHGSGAPVGSVSAAASQFVAATAVSNALTALGGQLTGVSLGVDAYVIVVLRQAITRGNGAAQQSGSALSAASPASCESSPTSPSATATHMDPSAMSSSLAATPPGTVVSSVASEFPFSSEHLRMVLQRITSCGGAVPPITVLDVCQAADLVQNPTEGAPGACTGVGSTNNSSLHGSVGGLSASSHAPTPRTAGAMAANSLRVHTGSADGSLSSDRQEADSPHRRMSPLALSPLSRAKLSLRSAMSNLKSSAAAMRVNYLSAFYENHRITSPRVVTAAPPPLPTEATGTLHGAVPCERVSRGCEFPANPVAGVPGSTVAVSNLPRGTGSPTNPSLYALPPQQPQQRHPQGATLQPALELALSSILSKDYAVSYGR